MLTVKDQSHLDPSDAPLMPIGFKSHPVKPDPRFAQLLHGVSNRSVIKGSTFPMDQKTFDINVGDLVFKVNKSSHVNNVHTQAVGHETLGVSDNIVISAVNGIDVFLGFSSNAATDKDKYNEVAHMVLSHITVFGCATAPSIFSAKTASGNASFGVQFGGFIRAPTHVSSIQVGEYVETSLPSFERINAPSFRMDRGIPPSKIGLILTPVREYGVSQFLKQVLITGSRWMQMSPRRITRSHEKQLYTTSQLLRFVKRSTLIGLYALYKSSRVPNLTKEEELSRYVAQFGLNGTRYSDQHIDIDSAILDVLSGKDATLSGFNTKHTITHRFGGNHGMSVFTQDNLGKYAEECTNAVFDLGIAISHFSDLVKSNVVGKAIRNVREGDGLDVALTL